MQAPVVFNPWKESVTNGTFRKKTARRVIHVIICFTEDGTHEPKHVVLYSKLHTAESVFCGQEYDKYYLYCM
jgi:hypothetical protein